MKGDCNMKKITFSIFLLALIGMVLSTASCKEDEVEFTPKESLKLQNYDLLFDCNASQGSVTVDAVGNVTVQSEQPWCNATASGNKVNVSVTDNTSTEGRSSKLTIKADGKEIVVVAQQKGLVFSVNDGNAYEVIAAAQEHVIDIAYSGNKEISVEPSDVDWVTFAIKDAKLYANCQLNTADKIRETEARVKAGGVTSTVTIRQKNLYFIVNNGNDYIGNDNATTVNLPISTPEGIEYSVAESVVDWARFSIVNGDLRVELDANETGKPRQTETTITYAGGLTTKFKIQQADFDKDVLGTYTLQYGSGSKRMIELEKAADGQFQWRFLDGNIANLGATIPVHIDQATNTMNVMSNVNLEATYVKDGVTYKLTTRILYQNSAGSLYSKNSDKLGMIGTLTIAENGTCTWNFVINNDVASTYSLYGLRIGYGTGGYTGWVGSYTTFANPVLVKE